MSNQIVISSGAKVRNLDGVLTGTSGIVNSVPLGAANGVATLDSGGKVPVSQLPSSVVTYLGTWNAATNTPTLVNGTGDAGDMYICNVAGTVNFGAGPVTFAVGDWVLYGSGTWQKSNGQNGTVTSVGVSRDGDALSITGSPITTAGTINIGFTGSNGQYINGEGDLVTFPSLTGYVPYTGATSNVDLGVNFLIANAAKFDGSGSFGGHIALKQNGIAAAYTGYATLSSIGVNKLNIYYGEAAAYTTELDNSLLTESRLYKFPDLSGTLALLEGTQTFTGIKTFNLSTKNETGIQLKNDIGIVPVVSGYTNLNGLTNGLAITNNSGVSNNLLVPSTTGYSYTFPAASGTIALTSDLSGYVTLGTYQTITANKSFSGWIKADNALFLSNSVAVASSTGYGTITYNKTGVVSTLRITNENNATASLIFDNTTNYDYTFPDVSGTIALTSDIPSLTGYVPYTGATANVNLGTYGLTAGVGAFSSSGGSGTFTIDHSSGSGVALTITKGGNGEGLIINKTSGSGNALSVTGSTSLGALSGTSATFSGDLSVVESGNALLRVQASTNTTPIADIELMRGTNTTWGADGYGDYRFRSSGGDLTIQYGDTGVTSTRLTIASTGAATFSSTVEALRYQATSSSASLVGFGVGTGLGMFNAGTDTLGFSTASTERMRITSGGNVGIGTTSPTSYITRFLEVSNATSSGIKFTGGTSGLNLGVSIGYITSDKSFRITNYESTGVIRLETQDTERMRITSGGEVQINSNVANGVSGTNFRVYGYSGNSFFRLGNNTSNSLNIELTRSDSATMFSVNGHSGAALFATLGTGLVYSSGGFLTSTNPSDERLKDNITDISWGLSDILKLRPVSYHWKDDKINQGIQYGFIAQEVQDVMPEAIKEFGEDVKYLGLEKDAIYATLVKAIQEQTQIIKDLEARIVSLESK